MFRHYSAKKSFIRTGESILCDKFQLPVKYKKKIENYRIWFCHGETKKSINALVFDMTLVVNFKSQWVFISFDSDTKERVVKRLQDR